MVIILAAAMEFQSSTLKYEINKVGKKSVLNQTNLQEDDSRVE